MRVLWLPTVLRAAGLTVREVAGWKTRGADSFGPVRGITCHHTAGSRTSSDAGEIGVLVNGRPGLLGPIAQLYLSRSGDWHVVASGHCNHNLVGWAGPNEGYGNDALLGIEAQHSGDGEPWTARQYDSYVRGVAALVRHEASGWDVTVARVASHKEHQPGAKTDPSFDMNAFRARVRAEIATWEDELNDADWKRLETLIDKAATTAAERVWKTRFNIEFGKGADGKPNPPYLAEAGSILAHVPSEHGGQSAALAEVKAAVAELDAAPVVSGTLTVTGGQIDVTTGANE